LEAHDRQATACHDTIPVLDQPALVRGILESALDERPSGVRHRIACRFITIAHLGEHGASVADDDVHVRDRGLPNPRRLTAQP
jgi:hypothetical protein